MNTNSLAACLGELGSALRIISVVGQVDGHDVVRRASVVDVASRRLDWARGLEVAAVAAAAAPAATPDAVAQLVGRILAEVAVLEEIGYVPDAWQRVAERILAAPAAAADDLVVMGGRQCGKATRALHAQRQFTRTNPEAVIIEMGPNSTRVEKPATLHPEPAPAVCGGDGLGMTSCATPHHVRLASGQTWCRWECTSCGGKGRDTWD